MFWGNKNKEWEERLEQAKFEHSLIQARRMINPPITVPGGYLDPQIQMEYIKHLLDADTVTLEKDCVTGNDRLIFSISYPSGNSEENLGNFIKWLKNGCKHGTT